MLESVVAASAKHFRRAIIMPNLVPPVITQSDAMAYAKRITDATTKAIDANTLAAGTQFTPLMTLYLTDQSDAADIVYIQLPDVGAKKRSAVSVHSSTRPFVKVD